MINTADNKTGWIFRNSRSAVYIIPEAVKEFNKIIRGDNKLEKSYFNLITFWTKSDSHPPTSICKKIKGVKEELHELKKSGTQARLLGYYINSDFFVLKCIQKKATKLKIEDIQTLENRKQNFNAQDIKWEEQK